jgi:ferric-dicitrate binding protein FerR (iron transport regulator)
LGGHSLPLVQDIVIRSRIGHVLIELAHGSRLTVLPSDIVQLRDANGTIEVVLVRGRLMFQFSPDSRVEILTPQARLQPVRQQASTGEVFISVDNVVGVKMTQGRVQVQELMDPS